MAKKWTKASVNELMELVRDGSFDQIESFFADNGYEKLPPREKTQVRFGVKAVSGCRPCGTIWW